MAVNHCTVFHPRDRQLALRTLVPHNATAQIRVYVIGGGSLGRGVSFIEFDIHFAELQMTSRASLMHKVNKQINMLGPIASADRAFRPGNASLIISEHWSRSLLWKAVIAQEFTGIDFLLNHSRGRGRRDKFRFSRGQGVLGALSVCRLEREEIAAPFSMNMNPEVERRESGQPAQSEPT